jgi:outer membrane protein assembly factor BamB
MNVIFSSVKSNIIVSQDENGSYSWLGRYDGMPIKQAIPTDGGTHCVLLLDPDASDCQTFRNLLCIDVNGRLIWNAELPTSPDVFLDVSLSPEGLIARTWSGMQVVIDGNSGGELNRQFNK